MKIFFKFILTFIIIATILFFIGPRPSFEDLDQNMEFTAYKLNNLDSLINVRESSIKDLKLDNEARIVWFDSITKAKTRYSIVYLHGFSASQGEGMPVHTEFAKKYGCNLYLSRMTNCGILNKDSFKGIQPNDLIESAREAISIGKSLGDSLIVMACSTGATYASYLVGGDPQIAGLIFYSPNIDLYDKRSNMILGPWGKQITKYLAGGDYRIVGLDDERKKYWTNEYHIDGILAMKFLLNETMVESTFNQINQPLFLGCYYKDEENQDKIVSVEKMREFFENVSTPNSKKRYIEFPEAGHHVICSPIMSKDVDNVKLKSFAFAEEILGLQPVFEKIETNEVFN